MPVAFPMPCPCGHGRPYPACCGPLHLGAANATTAEQLMRSRYSAYARDHVDYLLRTWHPRTRPTTLESPAELVWTGLQIVDTTQGAESDDEGTVTFRASFERDGVPGVREEHSRFVRRGGRWTYLDAITNPA